MLHNTAKSEEFGTKQRVKHSVKDFPSNDPTGYFKMAESAFLFYISRGPLEFKRISFLDQSRFEIPEISVHYFKRCGVRIAVAALSWTSTDPLLLLFLLLHHGLVCCFCWNC